MQNKTTNQKQTDALLKWNSPLTLRWVFGVVLFVIMIAVLTKVAEAVDPNTPREIEITQGDFQEMLRNGDVKQYGMIEKRNLVKLTLGWATLSKASQRILNKTAGSQTENTAVWFRVASVESFHDDMQDFYKNNLQVQKATENVLDN